ncbi:MAG: cell envelope integrity protein TolA, partial [Gemella haemolysans]|uniref:cell envelope integrity protein TolA n=1 Tax=Gemella haemolysans TaxID=1379 RepID=UPI003FA05615
MKNATLLKVLSASAIFTAIAAIESYDHNAFATEVTATASNTQSDVETKTVPQDVKNLPDGTYDLKKVGDVKALNFSQEDKESMAAAGLDTEKTKLVVKNGQYSVNVSFKPIEKIGFKGYLGDLKYYDGDKTHANRSEIKDSEFKDATIVENYSENEKDASIDTFKKKFPGRTVYPKTLSYNVDKNKIDANNKLETFTQVFVPVMESIFPGAGTQRMILNYDLSSLATKTITEPKYNLVPLTMIDATANTKSMGDDAIDKSKTRVEKVGDTYHYYVTTKDLAFGPYVGELTNLTVNGTTTTLTELGGSNHEKLYHFTSKEKYDVVNVTVDVAAGGRPFHKNTPARFAFDWAKATPLTKDIVNQLQNEEKAKANEKVAADKKAKEEKARIEAEKLAKEKAEKERIEAEKLAKEKAEKERIEAEKLAKEKAEKERIEAEKLAKE